MNANINMNEIKRGDIWWVNFGVASDNKSRLQQGCRPAVCASNDICNKKSPVPIFIALTSNEDKVQKTREGKSQKTWVIIDAKCGITVDSVALCEQPRPIDKHQINFEIGKIGTVDEETMILIERALMTQFGIKNTANTHMSSNQIINTTTSKSIDMDRAKNILKSINKVNGIIKNLNEPTLVKSMTDVKVSMLKEFKLYCQEFNKNCEEVINEIKSMLPAKQENMRVAM